jgi:DNA end-binding protein Ku
LEATTDVKVDPEMVQLAKQLIDRQTTRYDPSDIEDHYETRLRAMIDAKLKGEGIETDEAAAPERTNVIDLMAALKNSLGQSGRKEAAKPAASKPKRAAASQATKVPRKRA